MDGLSRWQVRKAFRRAARERHARQAHDDHMQVHAEPMQVHAEGDGHGNLQVISRMQSTNLPDNAVGGRNGSPADLEGEATEGSMSDLGNESLQNLMVLGQMRGHGPW